MSETALILNELPHDAALRQSQPTQAQLSTRITATNAKELAAKSWEARRKREQALRDAAEAQTKATQEDARLYLASTLLCVRKQLKKLSDMMSSEDDPQKLDRLASAYAKLSEQERILDGRPLPGSRRPRPEKPTKDTSTVEPVD